MACRDGLKRRRRLWPGTDRHSERLTAEALYAVVLSAGYDDFETSTGCEIMIHWRPWGKAGAETTEVVAYPTSASLARH